MTNPVDLVREATGFTQSDIAQKLGVSRFVVSVWKKRGEIPVRQVKRIAEISGLPCSILCPKYFPKQNQAIA